MISYNGVLVWLPGLLLGMRFDFLCVCFVVRWLPGLVTLAGYDGLVSLGSETLSQTSISE